MSRRFGEYPGDQRAELMNTTRDPKHGRGPLHSPIINPDDPKNNEWMRQLWRTFEEMGILKPKEIQSFLQGGVGTNLVANTQAIIATFTMPENQDGFLEEIFVDVAPPGSANIVLWSLMINGGNHPQFNQILIPAIGIWTGFEVQLNRGQKVDLVAQSTGVPAVSGSVRGWGRLIPDQP